VEKAEKLNPIESLALIKGKGRIFSSERIVLSKRPWQETTGEIIRGIPDEAREPLLNQSGPLGVCLGKRSLECQAENHYRLIPLCRAKA